jgi:uncharacterized membrane protein YkoI
MVKLNEAARMSGGIGSKAMWIALVAGLGLALPGAGTARAGDGHDHDRARRALEAGEVLPLRTILQRVERDYPGQIMEVELEQDDGRWLYEIKVLRTGGALVKLKIDARDGRLVAAKSRPGAPGKAP